MKRFTILLVPLLLTACQSAPVADAAAVFAKICRAEPAVHAAFVVLAPVAHIDPGTVAKEMTAHLIVEHTCANPPTDTATVIRALQDAWTIILDSQSSAVKSVR